MRLVRILGWIYVLFVEIGEIRREREDGWEEWKWKGKHEEVRSQRERLT
jgi:hypothetical protein